MSPPRRLILASASPRRESLLREAGYELTVYPADIDEAALTGGSNLSADDLPVHLAHAKAAAIAGKFPGDVILAADTIVAVNSHILGKAADADEARRILSLLSGSTHRVITGVVVITPATNLYLHETVASIVEMNVLTPDQLETYIATNRWQGKAGAYGLQDADAFVRRISGCMTNIVGLPMTTTRKLLGHAGIR